MDVIVLVGGLGTRLQSVVKDVPKPLAPVNGRPFLDILLDKLDKFSIFEKVVLAVGYKSKLIIERYKSNRTPYKYRIAFSEEDHPLGTAGAVRNALDKTESDNVCIINGDSLTDIDYEKMAEAHLKLARTATLAITRVQDVSRYGAIRLDESTLRIVEFLEKDGANGEGWINAGSYIVKKSALLWINADIPSSLEKEFFPRLISQQRAYAWPTSGNFIDIGTPEAYSLANTQFGHAECPYKTQK